VDEAFKKLRFYSLIISILAFLLISVYYPAAKIRIVDQTLKVLINLKEFSFLQNNIDELLSVKERLRNQLINSEQQKGNSYLRTWIKEAMQND